MSGQCIKGGNALGLKKREKAKPGETVAEEPIAQDMGESGRIMETPNEMIVTVTFASSEWLHPCYKG